MEAALLLTWACGWPTPVPTATFDFQHDNLCLTGSLGAPDSQNRQGIAVPDLHYVGIYLQGIEPWSVERDEAEVWEDFAEDGELDPRIARTTPQGAAAWVKFDLEPDETKEIPFVLSWHFPFYESGPSIGEAAYYTHFLGRRRPDNAIVWLAEQAVQHYGAETANYRYWQQQLEDWQRTLLAEEGAQEGARRLDSLAALLENDTVWTEEGLFRLVSANGGNTVLPLETLEAVRAHWPDIARELLKNREETSMAAETQITLTQDDLRLDVSPLGAALRGLSRVLPSGETEGIITGYQGTANKIGGQGDVLIPFPGRVAGGKYTIAGQTHQMPQNDKNGPNAIHGFLRSLLWEVEEETAQSIRFGVTLSAAEYAAKGYPFSLRAQVSYRLEAGGLTCAFAIRNTGDQPAPVAAGFHPYFTVGSDTIDADLLHLPMDSFLEFDDHLIPTGRIVSVEGTPYDFRHPRAIGSLELDTCYLHPRREPDGTLPVRLSNPTTGRTITITIDPNTAFVVVYSGDTLSPDHRRHALAIEPMTCASDAFNHPTDPDWGLRILAPGESLEGWWSVTL